MQTHILILLHQPLNEFALNCPKPHKVVNHGLLYIQGNLKHKKILLLSAQNMICDRITVDLVPLTACYLTDMS